MNALVRKSKAGVKTTPKARLGRRKQMAVEIVSHMTEKENTHITGLAQTVKDLRTWLSGKELACVCCPEFSPQHLENKKFKTNSLRKIHSKMNGQKMRTEPSTALSSLQ